METPGALGPGRSRDIGGPPPLLTWRSLQRRPQSTGGAGAACGGRGAAGSPPFPASSAQSPPSPPPGDGGGGASGHAAEGLRGAPPEEAAGAAGGPGAPGGPRLVLLEAAEEAAALLLVPEEGAGAAARGARRRRRRGAEAGGGPAGGGGAWGSRLPLELLERVLALGASDAEGGAVPFLCRAACVCRLWRQAAAAAGLWRRVSLGHCWAAPGQKWAPAQQKKALGTLEWLAAHRFSLLRDFTLSHWKSLVPAVLQALATSSPHLTTLHLAHCSGVTANLLGLLATSCPRLANLNLQGSQVDPWALTGFLETAGARMEQLSLTYSSRMSAILALLGGGCCPDLRLLEVNAEIKRSTQEFQLPIEQLQAACPQLQVLRLLNLTYYPKQPPTGCPPSLGFPQLEELCLATTAFSYVDNHMLWRILSTSSRLRVLDLRGCVRVTPEGLEQLPCPDLEQLYLGLHYSDSSLSRPLEGSPLLTWKWRHSLRELDLTSQSFSEEDLQQAMAAFTQGGGEGGPPLLRFLSLTGTKVALRTVRSLISSCPALTYLNLSSCRQLPRGSKRAYRGPEEIGQCLGQLLSRSEAPEAPRGAT